MHKDMTYTEMYQTLLSIKGSIQNIAEAAQVSRNTVRNVLHVGTKGPATLRVQNAATQYLLTWDESRKKELQALSLQLKKTRARARALAET
jgi:hypothetical protein